MALFEANFTLLEEQAIFNRFIIFLVRMERELHIFIADDDSDDRDFAIDALKETGYNLKFSCFTNGRFLTNYFLRDTIPLLPDAIVLDLNMPVKDGYESLKELKELHIAKSIPIFVLTSSTSEKDREVCQKLGCTAFFSKPLVVSEYQDIAQEILTAISDEPHRKAG